MIAELDFTEVDSSKICFLKNNIYSKAIANNFKY